MSSAPRVYTILKRRGNQPIEVVSTDEISSLFQDGMAVFRIAAISSGGESRDVGIVNAREDYERKMCTHMYNPVLFVISFPLRLAYLYGCLNHEYRRSHSETYNFLWRRVGSNDWNLWFRVHPYEDALYV